MKPIVKNILLWSICFPVSLLSCVFWVFLIWAQIDHMSTREAIWVPCEYIFREYIWIVPVVFGSCTLLMLIGVTIKLLISRNRLKSTIDETQKKYLISPDKDKWIIWAIAIIWVLAPILATRFHWRGFVAGIVSGLAIAVLYCFALLSYRLTRKLTVGIKGIYRKWDSFTGIRKWKNPLVYAPATTVMLAVIPLLLYVLSSSPSYTVLTGPVESDRMIDDRWDVHPEAMITDDLGNMYITAEKGSRHSLIEKYSSNGNLQWSTQYGYNSQWFYNPNAMAVDDSGNVYVSGSVVTIKCNSQGVIQWTSDISGSSIAVDKQGNTFIVGERGFSKLDDQGQELWYKRSTTLETGMFPSWSIAVSDQGNVYLSGPNIAYGIANNYAIVKYDTDGNHMWTQTYTTEEGLVSTFRDMVLDNKGNIYLTGSLSEENTLKGDGNLFTIKYNAEGTEIWVARYSDDKNYGQLSEIEIDAAGDIIVSGYLDTVAGITIKYDASGKEIWAAVDANNIRVFTKDAMAIDKSGNIYITGESLPVGSCITLKYNPDGVEQWRTAHRSGKDHRSWKVYYMTYPRGVTVDQADNVYVLIEASRNGANRSAFMELIKHMQ